VKHLSPLIVLVKCIILVQFFIYPYAALLHQIEKEGNNGDNWF
jgi:hypothetical protein